MGDFVSTKIGFVYPSGTFCARKKRKRMCEQSKQEDSLPSTPTEQEMVVLFKTIEQRLGSLEKKIDILINQSHQRPFRERNFSKPFRSFGSSHRRSDREYSRPFGEKSFDRRSHFENRHSEENRKLGNKSKGYDNPRESDFSREPSFKKRHNGDKKVFDQEKKPFYHKRKARR